MYAEDNILIKMTRMKFHAGHLYLSLSFIFGTILVLAAFYVIIQHTVGFGFINFIPQINRNRNFISQTFLCAILYNGRFCYVISQFSRLICTGIAYCK